MAYDFVRAREENIGFTAAQLTNTIRSDLVKSLQLTVAHDLFRTEGAGPCTPIRTPTLPCLDLDPPPPTSRSFAPHLSRVDASFEIDGNHWLFRAIGLGGRHEEAEPDSGREEDVAAAEEDPFFDERQPRAGQLMPGLRDDSRGFGPRGGPWSASLTYRLSRPRPMGTESSSLGDQSLRGNIRFQPTEKWSVNWNTDYSIKRREFGHHYLTLSRDLHDWDATFSFVKAQNGNFSFMFNISLRANPDLKFDYNQRDRTQF